MHRASCYMGGIMNLVLIPGEAPNSQRETHNP